MDFRKMICWRALDLIKELSLSMNGSLRLRKEFHIIKLHKFFIFLLLRTFMYIYLYVYKFIFSKNNKAFELEMNGSLRLREVFP